MRKKPDQIRIITTCFTPRMLELLEKTTMLHLKRLLMWTFWSQPLMITCHPLMSLKEFPVRMWTFTHLPKTYAKAEKPSSTVVQREYQRAVTVHCKFVGRV